MKDEIVYDKDYISPSAYDSYESAQNIINHLLFYKAIISEKESGEKINEYIEMANSVRDGLHLTIKDPFSKSIAITFSLVMENKLDPWNVDLARFANLYMKRIKGGIDIDFITAGRLMFMAWSVLKLQSDVVVAGFEKKNGEVVNFNGDWLADDGAFDYTKKVLSTNDIALKKMVWRKASRPVTLYELIGAFEEAKREMEKRMAIAQEIERERERWEELGLNNVKGIVHKEEIGEELKDVWKKIRKMKGKIPMSKLCNKNRGEVIKTLVALLFLAFSGKISVWQENFPFGMIYAKVEG
ncbi:MAG: hypothetical protein AB1779_03765 [Candidatus Thermoplasmatota archaeon]